MFERKIDTYKNYFWDFMSSLDENVARKVYYSLDILKTQQRISKKFVSHIREGVYELKVEFESNIYRVFFCFDEGRVVILFNGFHKKTQKTPENEIQKALQLKNEYYASKQQLIDKRR